MKATRILHDLGQSIWLDNITRGLLRTGGLRRYIDEFSVTGLTSNPTIFDHAIKNSSAYDASILKKLKEGKSGEDLFFELALEDLTRAADLFRPVHDRMPALLTPEGAARWLAGPDLALLVPAPAGRLVGREVSSRVNAVAHDGPELLEAPAPARQLKLV